MKNLYSLTKALLSITAAIGGSVAASGLHVLGYQVAAVAIQAIGIACLGLAMFWIVNTLRLTRQARDGCKRIALGDVEARILSVPGNDRPAELLLLVNDKVDGRDAVVR